MKHIVFVVKIENCTLAKVQKQSGRDVFLNMCPAVLQQMYKKTPMWKFNFENVTTAEQLCLHSSFVVCLNPFMPGGSKSSYSFIWGFFIKKVEILFVLNNRGCLLNNTVCHILEEVPQRCSSKKVFAKDATSLQENSNAEVYFQKSCFAEYFFLKTLLGDCFCCFYKETLHFLYPLWCYTHEWLSITKI